MAESEQIDTDDDGEGVVGGQHRGGGDHPVEAGAAEETDVVAHRDVVQPGIGGGCEQSPPRQRIRYQQRIRDRQTDADHHIDPFRCNGLTVSPNAGSGKCPGTSRSDSHVAVADLRPRHEAGLRRSEFEAARGRRARPPATALDPRWIGVRGGTWARHLAE